jgi:hypothetical protein
MDKETYLTHNALVFRVVCRVQMFDFPIFCHLASITFGLYFILFYFYFNGVMLSLKLVIPFFYFYFNESCCWSSSHSLFLTESCCRWSSSHSLFLFYFNEVILSLKLKSFLVCRFQHDKVYHVVYFTVANLRLLYESQNFDVINFK